VPNQLYGPGSALPYLNDITLHFKLYELHYDLVGTKSSDSYTMIFYGGVDGKRKRIGHGQLIGAGPGAAANRPTNRNSVYATLDAKDVFGLVRLLPHYDYYEVLNTSLVGVEVSIPYLFKWFKGYCPLVAEDLMTVVASVVSTRNEQVQIAHDGTSMVDMLWHSAPVVQAQHMANFGPKAVGIDVVKDGGAYRVSRLKGMKWYIPAGKMCRFRIRVPGVPRTVLAALVNPASYRYMDYGLLFSCKGDTIFSSGGTTNDAMNMAQQYIGIRRTSTTETIFQRLVTGREGFLLDSNRRTLPLPGAPQVTAQPTGWIENKAF